MNQIVRKNQTGFFRAVVVARTDELPDNGVKAAVVDGVELIVVRQSDAFSAYQGRCPHKGSLLSEGSMHNGILTCPAHGWQFNCRSGGCADERSATLRRFSAIVEGCEVKLDLDEVLAWKAQQQNCDSDATPHVSPRARSLDELPGPKGIPLFGNTLQIRPDRMHLVLERWSRKFGSVYKLRLMGRSIVSIADPVIISAILRDRPQTYRRWSQVEAVAHELRLDGILFAEGESWRVQRQVIAKALGPSHQRTFLPVLHKTSGQLLQRWDKAANEQRSIGIQRDLIRHALGVIMDIAFGPDIEALEGEVEAFKSHLEVVFPTLNQRLNAPFPYWHYVKLPSDRALERSLNAIQSLIRKVIGTSRVRLAQRKGADSLLDTLLKAQLDGGNRLTDDEVVANVFSILLAGHDSTANTLAWIVYFMCRHPHVQSKMQDEVDCAIKARKPLEHLQADASLPYLDAVINETLRLKSIVPVIGVEPNFDVEVSGTVVPKGTGILLLTREAALRQDHDPASSTFAPERWLSAGTAASHHQGGFMPFGSGPRLCPGRSLALMGIRSALVMLCGNFDIEQSSAASQVNEIYSFTVRPDNLYVRLRRRT